MIVNYEKSTDGKYTSLTLYPVDESRPSVEMTMEEYEIASIEIVVGNLKNNMEQHPKLAEFYQPQIDSLEAKLKELKGE